MPPVNRRQTLGPAGGKAKPPRMSINNKSSGSVASSNTERRRIPKSRKSMIPRCAGESNNNNNSTNRENNGRVSGIAAPSPSRHPSGGPRRSAARKSLGGAILQNGTTSSATPSKNRRVSIAPNNNSSNSTTAGSSANIDPRDIKDKKYLNDAIKKMCSYLKTRGYSNASSLNVKQLVNGPSGKDFQNIMTFLFRRVDPTFYQSPVGNNKQTRSDEVQIKFEDEVTMAFRCLGYPFPISKTGLVAVGSPHTWPALIAAIDWLVDVLTIRDEEEQYDWGPNDEDLNDEELLTITGSSERVEMQFHKFLRKSMVAFLNDNNEECEELEGGLLDEFMKDSEKVEVYLTGLDGECGTMKEEIAKMNTEVNGLSDAQAVMEEKAGKLEHFEGVIKMLTDHKAELTDKVETLTIEKSTSEQEMEDYSTKIKQLRETINSQELSQEDVRRMEREKIRVEEQIAKQNTILEGNVAALKEAQEKWSAIYQLLEQKVEEYNGQARQLELIPKNAKHAKGHTFEVKLDKRKAEDSAVNMMGGVDISGVAKPHVKKLAKGYEGEVLSQKRQLVEVKDQVEDVQRSSERVVDDIETIKDKISLCTDECDASRERLEDDIKGKRRELESLNTKISSLNDPDGVESTVAKFDSEYQQLQLQKQMQAKENEIKKKVVADEIRRAIVMAKEYEDDRDKELDEMNKYLQKKDEEARNKLKLLDS